MRHRKTDIAQIRVSSSGVTSRTLEQVMMEDPDHAVDMLKDALEVREVELKYRMESTRGLHELWDWIYGEDWRKGAKGPIPIRRRQAIKALALRDYIGIPWKEIIRRLGLRPEQQKSLENTVTPLRKLIYQNKIDFDVKPPRPIKKSSKTSGK
jgi:hypothetical protein